MINILSSLFKSKIDLGKTFEALQQGVDKTFYTNEERSEHDIQVADSVVEFYKMTLDESTIRSKTRRFVAIIIISVFLLITIMYALLPFFGIKTDHLEPLVFNSPLATGFITVIAFFFGGYYISRFVKKKKESKRDE